MKLATIDDGSLDGQLVVVSSCLTYALSAKRFVHSLLEALEDWDKISPKLLELSKIVNSERKQLARFYPRSAKAPLPRIYQALYASSYHNRYERLQQNYNSNEMHEEGVPLIYQGRSDHFLAPNSVVSLVDHEADLDIEAEVAVVVRPLPQGASREQCERAIVLVIILCDYTYRRLVPDERGRGFGFLRSKPHCSCAPIAMTLEESDVAWHRGRAHPIITASVNEYCLGSIRAGDYMQFGFDQLLEYSCSYRPLVGVTLMSSGTVYSPGREDRCSIIETRGVELATHGVPITPFLRSGDRISIDTSEGAQSGFGEISNSIVLRRAGSK